MRRAQPSRLIPAGEGAACIISRETGVRRDGDRSGSGWSRFSRFSRMLACKPCNRSSVVRSWSRTEPRISRTLREEFAWRDSTSRI